MAATSTTLSTTITSTCVCGENSLAVSFPNSSLPIDRALCICTSCRRLSGACGLSYVEIPSSTIVDLTKLTLTQYATSESLTRYFCSNCGAHFAVFVAPTKKWCLTTGLWDKTEEVVRWTGTKFAEGTLDGGVAVWLRQIKEAEGCSRVLKCWKSNDKNGELADAKVLAETFKPPPAKSEHDTLSAQCHCGGVKFRITRPDEASKQAQSEYPDLIVPYNTDASPANPENKAWWLDATGKRYVAGLCTCDSCRRASGVELQCWSFIPRINIQQVDGSPLDFSMGTLKLYKSKVREGVYRHFCGVCGATVFWHSDETPKLVDVSPALYDPEQGARVENWLEWSTERVSFEEEAVSRRLVGAVEDGFKVWEREKEGGKQ